MESWLRDLTDPAELFWPQIDTSNDHRLGEAINIMQEHSKLRSRASSPTVHEAKRTWYSAPPQLQIYDKEVINVLLNVARRHLSTTFGIYADFEAGESTAHELCLAMAALGGLFSSVDGSVTMAKSLYNDARRIHFEKTNSQPQPSSFKQALEIVKTHILLAVYGICSGDKRSYEFTEAFHIVTRQAMRYCLQITPLELDPADTRELSLTLEALEILESYRVLLLQRPPYFLSINHHHRQQSSLKLDLTPLFNPTAHSTPVTGCLREVANLGIYSWAASPRGQEYTRVPQLWRPEFIELGLERWENAQASSRTTTDLPSMLLYHLAHLHLQVNLGILQRLARSFKAKPKTPSEEKISDIVRRCTRGPSFKAAVWHAMAMLRDIKEHVAVSGRRQPEFLERPQILEPPHLPYCIYFATLMVWYSEYVVTGSHSITGNTCIENGIHLLGMLNLRVAKVLANALRELFPDEDRHTYNR